MEKKISKEKILEACINKQEELIYSFEERVKVSKADAYENDHSASQTESRTAGKVELLKTFEKELGFVKVEMDYLKSLKPEKQNSVVEPGAVVVTNKMTFFIAVSSEKIEVDGQVIFGMSAKAPIYSAMKGLTKGSSFAFNGIEYEILDVY